MHIREGQSVNKMISDAKILEVTATDGKNKANLEKVLYFSSMTGNSLHENLKVGEKTVKIELLEYLPTAEYQMVSDPKGKTILELKVSAGGKGELHYFSKGDTQDFGSFYISYDVPRSHTDKPTFKISGEPNALKVDFPFIMKTLNMDTKNSDEIKGGMNDLHKRTLYRFGTNAVVLKSINEKSTLKVVSNFIKVKSNMPEYIKLKVSVGDKSKVIVAKPYKGKVGELQKLELDGIKVDLRVGAKIIDLPFSIKLVDFELERYPGSMTPASYSSKVILIDKEANLTMPYHIYMNHILDYKNYRLFQSSYDPDEKGTILSVNHDPGTLPTYIGYILMALGMLWSLITPKGRFRKLLKNARKLQTGTAAIAVAVLLALNPQSVNAASPKVDDETLKVMKSYDLKHTLNFGKLAVQDHQGRMKPMDTVAHDVVAKITRRSGLYDLEPTQILLGMIIQPELYQEVPMIYIGHRKIALDIGLPKDTKYAKFSDFFKKEDGAYKIFDAVTQASRKKPLEKTKYDKELIKIDERVNVAFMAYQGSLMRIFPQPNDANNKWVAPLDAIKTFPKEQADMVKMSISAYFQMVSQGVKTGEWKNADLALKGIRAYQEKYGAAVIPSQSHIDMEIKYNKLGLFSKLVPLYLLLGIVLLIFAFINVLKPTFPMKWVMRISWSIFLFGFLLHIIGLGIRWYIAGHAPWSNAYESIVFIAASTVLAGVLLARNSPFALAGAAILAGITMGVAHMNFINPEITNLVPVLKSYWLMIHVSMMISGDGFFGLGSILSFLVLILYIIRGKNGNENIDRSIKELTNLSEMSLIIGIFLFTVANFLGGVWANESWGRYWGWDSKETWAAVSILIYAVVLHLRFIPSLKSNFIFNASATWAYSAVLMTYFGVNYYLSGLHSYAAGDPIPIPMWVYYAVAGLFILTLLAARNRKLK
jgi:cytochrome c-type biogenesis protein CcsB